MTVNLPQTLLINNLRELYQSGKLTPSQLISDIIQRSQSYEDFNIWIIPPSLEWIQPYLDRLNELDLNTHSLWGIPFAIKDNIDLARIPTTAGCLDYSYMPEEHAAAVTRLIQAGAIPVGKTNLDQFATGLVGTRSPYGETKNAYNSELISGGSSSGSAVAVALGLATFSLGTDTAGSGRVPAALNGLIGFKSSLGAWPTKGVVPACASLDCVTVFSNVLEDALAVDEVARGLEPSDPWSRSVKRHSSALPEKLLLPREDLKFFGPFAKAYETAWENTLDHLKTLLIPIEYIDGSYLAEAAAILYEGPWVAERWADLGAFIEAHPGSAFPVTETVLRSGARPEFNAASVFKAMHTLQAFKQKAHQQMENAVLVLPTAGGTWTRDQVRDNPIETNSLMGLYTNHCNLLDLCAINVPVEEAGEVLPFGITFFSRNDNEHLIAGLADRVLNGKNLPTYSKTTEIAVCGLHMKGFPLEIQMLDHRAVFVRRTQTAPSYKLIKLNTQPAKPGLIKTSTGGAAIEVEIWEMPVEELGYFAKLIPAPLGIGKVELIDGSVIPGFICEAIGLVDAENLTASGGWRYAIR